jgi:hypothetical protein
MFILVFLGILILIFLTYKYYEHKHIYCPDSVIIATPKEFGIEFQDVRFSSRDMVLLHGWFIKGQKEKVILFFHGNKYNISFPLHYIDMLRKLGYSVFLFDYRGYGKSNGIPTERGLYQDALGAYDFLIEKGYKGDDIVLFGRSLGGAVAINIAYKIKAKGLILDSSFTSMCDLSYDIFGFHFPKWLISNRYESLKLIKNLIIPKIIIHSKEDDLIPFYHGKRLFEHAAPPKEFLEIKGSHISAFSDSKEVYTQRIKKFLDSLWVDG